MDFKAGHREMQELARELRLLREHNKRFGPNDPQDTMLLFAEASVCLLAMERFLRIIPGIEATNEDTLPNLLEKATSKSRALIRLPFDSNEIGIRKIKAVRNTIIHGNFEQAAQQANCGSVEEYFRSQFASEIEALFKVLDFIMKQIDTESGRQFSKR